MSEVAAATDVPLVAHLATSLSVTIVFYAAVTRGSLVVARGLEHLVHRR